MSRNKRKCLAAQLDCVAHQLVHQPERECFCGVKQLAFQQVRLRAQQAQQARHFGNSACAGNQAQRNLWQAKLNFGVVHRNPVVPDQRQFPAAAKCRAV